jgi:hypothetical protein
MRALHKGINQELFDAARRVSPLQGDFVGLHIKDPDGVNVQISSQT